MNDQKQKAPLPEALKKAWIEEDSRAINGVTEYPQSTFEWILNELQLKLNMLNSLVNDVEYRISLVATERSVEIEKEPEKKLMEAGKPHMVRRFTDHLERFESINARLDRQNSFLQRLVGD